MIWWVVESQCGVSADIALPFLQAALAAESREAFRLRRLALMAGSVWWATSTRSFRSSSCMFMLAIVHLQLPNADACAVGGQAIHHTFRMC